MLTYQVSKSKLGCYLNEIYFVTLLRNSLYHLCLGNKLNALKSNFKALKKLMILEMEDCQLSQDGINELQPYLRSMPNVYKYDQNYTLYYTCYF